METLSDSAVTFLVNALWQISALLIIAAACARLILRNSSARRQYLFWVTVLILSVGVPIFSLCTFGDNSRFIFRLPFETSQAKIENPAYTFSVTAEAFSAESNEGIGAIDISIISRAIVIGYFLFLFYRLFRLLKMWRQTARLRRSVKNEQLPPLIETVAERCRAVLQINSVPVFFSAETAAPLTLGAAKPIIILPESFINITSEKTLTSVLGHESAHIRRGDYGWNLVLEFLSLPVSFHPAVTIMKRNINQTREMACDELVAESLLNPLDYASSLVQIAGFITPSSHNAITLGVFSADVLEKRIMKMIEKSRGAYKQTGKIRFLLSVTLLGITAMAATVFSLALPLGQKQKSQKNTIQKDETKSEDVPKPTFTREKDFSIQAEQDEDTPFKIVDAKVSVISADQYEELTSEKAKFGEVVSIPTITLKNVSDKIIVGFTLMIVDKAANMKQGFYIKEQSIKPGQELIILPENLGRIGENPAKNPKFWLDAADKSKVKVRVVAFFEDGSMWANKNQRY